MPFRFTISCALLVALSPTLAMADIVIHNHYNKRAQQDHPGVTTEGGMVMQESDMAPQGLPRTQFNELRDRNERLRIVQEELEKKLRAQEAAEQAEIEGKSATPATEEDKPLTRKEMEELLDKRLPPPVSSEIPDNAASTSGGAENKENPEGDAMFGNVGGIGPVGGIGAVGSNKSSK